MLISSMISIIERSLTSQRTSNFASAYPKAPIEGVLVYAEVICWQIGGINKKPINRSSPFRGRRL